MGTDPPRRLEAVQLRHLHVHEDDVVVLAAQRGERLEPVTGDVCRIAELFEQKQGEPLVHLVVLDEEDPQRRSLLARGGGRRLALKSRRSRGRSSEHAQERVVELRTLDRLRQVGRESRFCLQILLAPAKGCQEHKRQICAGG